MSTSVVLVGEQMIILKMIMMSLVHWRTIHHLGASKLASLASSHKKWSLDFHHELIKTMVQTKVFFRVKWVYSYQGEKCQNGILRHISTEIKLLQEISTCFRNKLQVIPQYDPAAGKVDNINLRQFYINWWSSKKSMINQFDDILSHPASTVIGSQTGAL